MPDQLFTQAIALLHAGQPQQAESLCQQALELDAGNANMLALLGVIQMKTERPQAAEASLRKTIAIEPRFARPHEDLAILYMQQQQPAMAEPLFRRVTELEPKSSSAWFGLAHALKALGRMQEASAALHRSAEYSGVKQLLDEAESLRQQGDTAAARAVCRKILQQEANNFAALRLLATVATLEGNSAEAEQLLRRIVELAPDTPQPLAELARFYTEQQRHTDSLDCLERGVKLDPSNPAMQIELAESLSLIGLPQRALQAYDAALSLNSNAPNSQLGRAHALRALGRADAAVNSYLRCIERGPLAANAWWSLSSLRTYQFTDAEVQAMMLLRQADGSDNGDAIYLDFALGKAMDDRHQFDAAWRYYSSANAARRTQIYYDGASIEAEFNKLLSVAEETAVELAATDSSAMPVAATPIFIVGMPRSGSTLLEQILASHSQVESTSELPYMLALGRPYLQSMQTDNAPAIATYSSAGLMRLRQQYLQASERHRLEGRPYFIDKMPDNFQMIGLIAQLFPNAKIVHAVRDPMDTCIGNYRQLFTRGKNFSYDLFELGEYYLQYQRMMRRWEELLPGKIIRVDYEQLLADTETEIARLLSSCGLDWEDSCLDFHQTRRAITSASSEQVRLPLYTSAIGFWKNYASHLDNLLESLQPAPD